jgi:hypothetical protein
MIKTITLEDDILEIEGDEKLVRLNDVKEALNCFEDNIATLYDEETQEQIKYFIKEIFGDFNGK